MSPSTKNRPKTRRIPLTQGFVALVDVEDYERLSKWKWHIDRTTAPNVIYATRNNTHKNGKHLKEGDKISMHREIMRPPKGKVVDHINGNGLDNRRLNLRICTRQGNSNNIRHLYKNNTSGIPCVSWSAKSKKWKATVNVNSKSYQLGMFTSKRQAALAVQRLKKSFGIKPVPQRKTP